MPQCYVCSLPNPGTAGPAHHCFYADDDAGRARAARFAEQENKPGRGVYYCIGKLQDGAQTRCKATVAELDELICDLDLRNIVEPREQVIKVLQELLLRPREIRDSGFGLHAVWKLKEAVSDEAGLAQAERSMAGLVALLAGDPAPTHRAALLRQPGTNNTKNGECRQCHAIEQNDRYYDIGEFEEMFDLYGDRRLLTRKDRPKDNGQSPDGDHGRKGPVDVDARLDAAEWHGPGDTAFNIVARDTMASQLRCGVCLTEAANVVFDRLSQKLPPGHGVNLQEFKLEILWSGARHIKKNPELLDRLPDALYRKFAALDRAGRSPVICKNNYGLFVRASASADKNENKGGEGAEGGASKPKQKHGLHRFQKPHLSEIELEWWQPIDPAKLPPREWLYGKHYQRGVVSGTVAPGGSGKTSQALVEAIAMATARNLLGEQPGERVRVWYHNAEDTQDEVNRRVVAVCQHYKIPQEELVGWFVATSCERFDLHVANGISEIKVNETLVDAIVDKIRKLQIDVAMFDPLVNLHTVAEGDPGKMNAVVATFRSIAQAENVAIELEHHTRKLPPGVHTEYTGADSRGASSVRDALRAQRVLNAMSKEEADRQGILEHERPLYFRVDIGKANNARPGLAIWRHIVTVDLANGDSMGVVTAWHPPGQGEITPEREAAQRTADYVFLQLLDRFTLEGRVASDKVSVNYAPHVFAQEAEAKEAKLSKAALRDAMSRLFKDRKISAVNEGSGGKAVHRLVRR